MPPIKLFWWSEKLRKFSLFCNKRNKIVVCAIGCEYNNKSIGTQIAHCRCVRREREKKVSSCLKNSLPFCIFWQMQCVCVRSFHAELIFKQFTFAYFRRIGMRNVHLNAFDIRNRVRRSEMRWKNISSNREVSGTIVFGCLVNWANQLVFFSSFQLK